MHNFLPSCATKRSLRGILELLGGRAHQHGLVLPCRIAVEPPFFADPREELEISSRDDFASYLFACSNLIYTYRMKLAVLTAVVTTARRHVNCLGQMYQLEICKRYYFRFTSTRQHADGKRRCEIAVKIRAKTTRRRFRSLSSRSRPV